MATIRVEGMAAFTQLCASIGEQAGARHLRPIIKRGAEQFAAAVRTSAAPSRDTGATISSVEAHLVRREDIAAGYATVDARRAVELRNQARQARGRSPVDNDARYPFIVAAGSPAHLITARNGKALLLAGTRGGARKAIRAVQHPGFRGTNFFAEGVRYVRAGVKARMEAEIKAEYTELARRYNVRTA